MEHFADTASPSRPRPRIRGAKPASASHGRPTAASEATTRQTAAPGAAARPTAAPEVAARRTARHQRETTPRERRTRIRRLTRPQIVALTILAVVTLVRLLLWLHTPILAQMLYTYDEGHYIHQAQALLAGDWLGTDPMQTMIKAPGYAFFLVFVFLTGLPYQFWLGVLVIVAAALFCCAIAPLIRHKAILAVIYGLLLFTPELFTAKPFMDPYRDFMNIPLSMVILSSYIALWVRRDAERPPIRWVVPATLALPLFWITTESAIWMAPFVLVATVLCAIWWLRGGRRWRTLWLGAPLAATGIAVLFICAMNLAHYGVFAVTVRYETSFADVTQDLVMLDSGAYDDELDLFGDNVRWVSDDELRQVFDASPTLQTLEPQLEGHLTAWAVPQNGGMRGDIVFWGLIESYFDDWEGRGVDEASFVDFWGRVHDELAAAYDEGTFERADGIQFSKTTMPIAAKDVGPLAAEMAVNLYSTVTGAYLSCGDVNLTALGKLSGSADEQRIEQIIIGGPMLSYDNETESFPGFAAFEPIIALNHKLMTAGRWIMVGLFPLAVIALIATIVLAIRRRGPARDAILPIAGLILTMLVLTFAVTWFSAWLSAVSFYRYAIALYPMYFMTAALAIAPSLDALITRLRRR